MVTFLLLFTNKKSFQSMSFSLPGKQGKLGNGEACPTPTLAMGGRSPPHSLHEHLDLVLQELGQLGASPARSLGQEAQAVDGTKLPLQLPAYLEQPGHQERRASQREGP